LSTELKTKNFRNAAKEIKERADVGQPVLVGTISVENPSASPASSRRWA